MKRTTIYTGIGVAAAALLATLVGFAPARGGHPAYDYLDDYAYECLQPDQAGADTVTYRGHITVTLRNLAGDYAEKDLFFSDGNQGYGTTTFKAQYRISGHTIGGSAYTNGGDSADVRSLNTFCIDVPAP